MDIESILKPIDRFLEEVKGTEFEERALQMRKEIVSEVDAYYLQLQADGAHDDWLSEQED